MGDRDEGVAQPIADLDTFVPLKDIGFSAVSVARCLGDQIEHQKRVSGHARMDGDPLDNVRQSQRLRGRLAGHWRLRRGLPDGT